MTSLCMCLRVLQVVYAVQPVLGKSPVCAGGGGEDVAKEGRGWEGGGKRSWQSV